MTFDTLDKRVLARITYWNTHDLYTHDLYTHYVIDLDWYCYTHFGMTMIPIHMIAIHTFTCNSKVLWIYLCKVRKINLETVFWIINLYLNHTKSHKNRNILLVQMTNTSHPSNKVVAVVGSDVVKDSFIVVLCSNVLHLSWYFDKWIAGGKWSLLQHWRVGDAWRT